MVLSGSVGVYKERIEDFSHFDFSKNGKKSSRITPFGRVLAQFGVKRKPDSEIKASKGKTVDLIISSIKKHQLKNQHLIKQKFSKKQQKKAAKVNKRREMFKQNKRSKRSGIFLNLSLGEGHLIRNLKRNKNSLVTLKTELMSLDSAQNLKKSANKNSVSSILRGSPLSYLISRNIDFNDEDEHFRPVLFETALLKRGDSFGINDLLKSKIFSATFATLPNFSEAQDYTDVLFFDYKLFQLHLDRYFRAQLVEKKSLIKFDTFNGELHNLGLFDNLVHDFKECEALKAQKLFRFKDRVTHAFILLEGEVKITSSMVDEQSQFIEDLICAKKILNAEKRANSLKISKLIEQKLGKKDDHEQIEKEYRDLLGVEHCISKFGAKKYKTNSSGVFPPRSEKLTLLQHEKNPLKVEYSKSIKPLEMYLVGKGQLFGELGCIPELGITQHF